MDWFVLETQGKGGAGQVGGPPGRKRTAVIIAALLLLALLSFAGLAWAKKTVNLSCDEQTLQVKTLKRTVQDVLDSQAVLLGEKDRVVPAPESLVTDNMDIAVLRAFYVEIVADGGDSQFLTCADTVGEVLDEYNLELGSADFVEPLIEESAEKGMTIKVTRVTEENIEEDVAVPYNTKYQETSSLLKGQTKVINAGSKGTEKQYWKVTYHDGEEVERELVRKELAKAPVDRIVQVGTQQSVSRGGEPFRFTEVRRMEATGYTHTGYRTASGVMPSRGTAAVDTRIIPFGTRLYIEGYGYGAAKDRGGAIKGDRIDLFFETRQEALNWGRRWVDVYILE